MALEKGGGWRRAMFLGTGSMLLGLALSVASWEEGLGPGPRLAISITGLAAAVAGMYLVIKALAGHAAEKVKKG